MTTMVNTYSDRLTKSALRLIDLQLDEATGLFHIASVFPPREVAETVTRMHEHKTKGIAMLEEIVCSGYKVQGRSGHDTLILGNKM